MKVRELWRYPSLQIDAHGIRRTIAMRCYPLCATIKLPRFRGHLPAFERGIHDAGFEGPVPA